MRFRIIAFNLYIHSNQNLNSPSSSTRFSRTQCLHICNPFVISFSPLDGIHDFNATNLHEVTWLLGETLWKDILQIDEFPCGDTQWKEINLYVDTLTNEYHTPQQSWLKIDHLEKNLLPIFRCHPLITSTPSGAKICPAKSSMVLEAFRKRLVINNHCVMNKANLIICQ